MYKGYKLQNGGDEILCAKLRRIKKKQNGKKKSEDNHIKEI
jgi:hypothetical protein